MSRGSITRRGKASWRLKFDVGTDAAGRRQTRYVTVRGRLQHAQRELTRLLAASDAGTLPEPRSTTVAEYIRAWLDGQHGLRGKTAERYRQLAEGQIIPHIGTVQLQKLRPTHIEDWHAQLQKPNMRGRALSARTVGHAHRVLHRALARAMSAELVSRNVASAIRPPRVEQQEIEILSTDQIGLVLDKLQGRQLYPIAALALATGLRRGELLALQIGDFDLDAAVLRVERSLEETAAGLRFKPSKTKHGRRSISLPAHAVAVLRTHWRQQLERRLALGLGKPEPATLVFSHHDGAPISPDNLSRDWRRACRSLKLPLVMFHALRHTHASALIASGLDVVQISRRLGHSSPVVTLRTYAHLFANSDSAAAAIENVLRTPREQ
ncbi:MAG: tyrosine-type recombinase/integrase [Hyphomicrobiaceae bacterium]